MPFIEIKFTIPKDLLRQSIVQDSIAQMMKKKTAPEVYSLFKGTVEDWSNKPTFRRKLTRRASFMSMTLWADGTKQGFRGINASEQYALVNRGARRHSIPSSGSTFMRFQDGRGYKAATTPRILKSGPRSNSGAMIVKYQVDHPGFEGRKFDETIAKQYAPTFREDMRDAISVAAQKSAKIK